jgi:tetratricopeptide (TPR) repeat protein
MPAKGEVQAVSWLGRPLMRRTPSAEAEARFKAGAEKAAADIKAAPDDPSHKIWLGRYNAYLGDYRAAIAVYSSAIGDHADHAPLYRHRGHRLISTRNLEAARADLEKAASLIEDTNDEVEPDGLPNAKNLPRSTLHTNVWYHLGLVHFLEGSWEAAVAAYRSCLAASKNDDMRVATLHWLYMALRRLGRYDEARSVLGGVSENMDIIENHAYHQLLLLYAGHETPESLVADLGDDVQNPALLFGLANYHLVEGREDQGYALMQQIVDTMRWDAFGTIAAEADLARRNPLVRCNDEAAGPGP